MRTPASAVLLLMIAVWLPACSPTTTTRIYDGAERPASEIAIVTGDRYLDVRKVDGKEGHFSAQVFRGPLTSSGFELHLLPGSHVIEVGYGGDLYRSVAPATLHFVAQKGKRYRVRYEVLQDVRRWRAWIEEDAGA